LSKCLSDSRPGAIVAAVAEQNAFTDSDVWSCRWPNR